jgi:cyclic pyranopterin phosphate synthase
MSAGERLPHLDETGAARMVDVSGREVGARTAEASGEVRLRPETVQLLRDRAVPKGDVAAVARIAGVMAAKAVPQLIPLCHPIALHGVDVDVTVTDQGVALRARVRTADRTGVEMEALTAVSVAALAVVDMVKSLDPGAVISEVRVEQKSGGRSGLWRRGER